MPELSKFDPKRLAVKELLELPVESVGMVRYGKLTMRDMADIQVEKDEITQAYIMVHRMLSKAEPSLTLEELADWDAEIFTRIFTALSDASDFRERK